MSRYSSLKLIVVSVLNYTSVSEDSDLKKVQNWCDSNNETLYLPCWEQFRPYLQSDISLGSYVFYMQLKDMTDIGKKKLGDRSKASQLAALGRWTLKCSLNTLMILWSLLLMIDSNSFAIHWSSLSYSFWLLLRMWMLRVWFLYQKDCRVGRSK